MDDELNSLADQRLIMIRRLIELAYTYSDKEIFYDKFIETVSIDSLKNSDILRIDAHAPNIPTEKELTVDEVEMYSLMQQGFTPQEISVIYREKSVNAVYIKRHRLKKKLKGAASPEIVLVMLVLCLIAYLIGYLTGRL